MYGESPAEVAMCARFIAHHKNHILVFMPDDGIPDWCAVGGTLTPGRQLLEGCMLDVIQQKHLVRGKQVFVT